MEFEGAFFDTTDFEFTNKFLGKGQFGSVYIVKNENDNKEYAAKIIHTNNVFKGRQQMLLMREVMILRKLNHPSIVKFYGINFHSFNDPTKLEPTIITEYLSHGSLKSILDNEKLSMANDEWTPTKKYISLLGISHAMSYMHHHGILHRDLKPENILIDDDFFPRICDFGLSRCFPDLLTNSVQLIMTNNIGTPLYMAPELFTDEQDDQYGPGIDVYAFSMLAYEIVTGKVPFSESEKRLSFSNLIQKVLSGQRPSFNEFATEKMKNLISKCWDPDPKERPSFDEIFHSLSEDLTYFDEYVDKDEVNSYIDILNEAGDELQKDSIYNEKEMKIKKLKSEIDELKQKIDVLEEENKVIAPINPQTRNMIMKKYRTFEEIIEDKDFFEELVNFSRDKLVVEFPLFYKDAQNYKKITEKDTRRQAFIKMRDMYASVNSDFRVNCHMDIIKNIQNANENDPSPDVFDEMLSVVFTMIKTEILPPFKRSKRYQNALEKKMKSDKNNKLYQLYDYFINKFKNLDDILMNQTIYYLFMNFCEKKKLEFYVYFCGHVLSFKQNTDPSYRQKKYIQIRDMYLTDGKEFYIGNDQLIIPKKVANANEKHPPSDVFDEIFSKVKNFIEVEIVIPFQKSPEFEGSLPKLILDPKFLFEHITNLEEKIAKLEKTKGFFRK